MIEDNDIIIVYDRLKGKLLADCDMRYRKIDDCNDITDKTDERQTKIEVSFAKGITKLNILIAILVAIAGPVLGLCIKYLFGG